jgi:aspartate oxidase
VAGVRYFDSDGVRHEIPRQARSAGDRRCRPGVPRNDEPGVATGDGIALAFHAGARVSDLEFVQFHPTALSIPGAPRILISEALRGEGARLVNDRGEAFMPPVPSGRRLSRRATSWRAASCAKRAIRRRAST